MPARSPFRIFFVSVWGNWEARFGTTFAVVLATVQYGVLAWVDPPRVPGWVRSFPPYLWLAIGLVFLFWACYAAWRTEYGNVIQLQGRPEVSLSLLRVGGQLDGQWLFRLVNASEHTAMNVGLSPITDGIVVYEFQTVPSVPKSPAATNMTYSAKLAVLDTPLPPHNTDMLQVFRLGKAHQGIETYETKLEFSNYGGESAWQLDYSLECDFSAQTMNCRSGTCRKIR